MSANLNQRKLRTLLSNTIQNPKNHSLVLAITTGSGITTIDPLLPILEVPMNDGADIDKISVIESEKVAAGEGKANKDKGTGEVHEPAIKLIP